MRKPYTIEYDEMDTGLYYVVETADWWWQQDKVISAHRTKPTATQAILDLINGTTGTNGPSVKERIEKALEQEQKQFVEKAMEQKQFVEPSQPLRYNPGKKRT